jgi:hypothetical protein
MVCSTHKQTLQHFNSYLVNQALESGLTWIELRTASVFVKRGQQAENCACRLRCSGSVSRCLFFPLLVFGSVYFPFSFRRNEGWLGLWKLLKHRPMSRNCFAFDFHWHHCDLSSRRPYGWQYCFTRSSCSDQARMRIEYVAPLRAWAYLLLFSIAPLACPLPWQI